MTSGETDLDRLLLRFPQAVLVLGRDGREVLRNDESRRLLGDADLADLLDRLELDDGRVDERLDCGGRALRVVGAADDESILLVLEDVTAQHREERAVQEFVRNAAHQLRTPLTGIATAVEVLQSGAKNVESDRDRFLDHVARHTARLLRIVRGLLALARTESGEPLRLGAVAVAPVLARRADEAEPARGVTIDVACAADVRALADPNLLEEALAALIENAVAHTAAGAIRMSASTADGLVTIDVVDSGDGIAAAQLDRVFEPFFRDTTEGEGDRFGLGLTIAGQAVRAMGGRIEARPADAGAHFAITLRSPEEPS